jgi:hypothetical protein
MGIYINCRPCLSGARIVRAPVTSGLRETARELVEFNGFQGGKGVHQRSWVYNFETDAFKGKGHATVS